jgi:hypothetical protein
MSIITVAELQISLQQTVTFSDFHTEVAQQCCDLASAEVVLFCPKGADWTPETAPLSAKLVALRLAGRLMTNPQQRTSYSGPEGLNYSGGPVRLLTDDEKKSLMRLNGNGIKSVKMTGRRWPMTESDWLLLEQQVN